MKQFNLEEVRKELEANRKKNQLPLPKQHRNQTIDEFLNELNDFCHNFHDEVKSPMTMQLNSKMKKNFFDAYLKHSHEPQYKIIRLIKAYKKDSTGENAFKITEAYTELETYIKKVRGKSLHDLQIRLDAEIYYLQGFNQREIVDKLIASRMLDTENSDNHVKRIQRYTKEFKSLDMHLMRESLAKLK